MIKIKEIESLCDRMWKYAKSSEETEAFDALYNDVNDLIPNTPTMGWNLFNSVCWFSGSLDFYKHKMVKIVEILYEVE